MNTDIIILTAYKGGMIERCLDSIQRHVDLKKIGKVVVGCTTDSAFNKASLLKSRYSFTLQAYRLEYHFAKCCNALAKKCSSRARLFMNDDVELLEDAVSPCLNVLEKDSRVGTVGIKLLYGNRTI